MTDNTLHLGMPYIDAAQAQKHVTHNDALRTLDALVMLSVLDRDLSAPPDDPAEGDRYLVKATGSGAFTGKDDQVAHFCDGGWMFYAPAVGWSCYLQDEAVLLCWSGSAWSVVTGTSGAPADTQDLDLLGIGTTADADNPFAAMLNSALWTARYAADGGNGDLRYIFNKEGAANTGSLLFQSAFSGRAEFGLTGDDDFHLKVSGDGTAWSDALLVDNATGAVKLNSAFFLTGDISPSQIAADQNDYNPAGLAGASVIRVTTDAGRAMTGLSGGGKGRIVALVNAGSNSLTLKDSNAASSAGNRFAFGADVTLAAAQSAVLWYDSTDTRWKLFAGPVAAAASGGRSVLSGNRTYYVRADGSDSNSGLVNNSGGAFLTIQKAVDAAVALDLSIYAVTVQVADGTYADPVVLKSYLGVGPITIQGNTATPANVLISTTAASGITADGVYGQYVLNGLKIQTTTSGNGVWALRGSIVELRNTHFGAVANAHIRADSNATVAITTGYTIGGGAQRHFLCTREGILYTTGGPAITLSGTPAFSSAFADCQGLSSMQVNGITFSGSASGTRYNVSLNSIIDTIGGGASYFPGNAAGTTATGGQYS